MAGRSAYLHRARGVLCWAFVAIGAAVRASDGRIAVGRPGKVPGVMSWVVPATPNGLVPNQAWLSLGGTPDGDIYIAGSDHKTNAALYRLRRTDDRLIYVGDARAASEAAHNWLPGETAEKIHVRPLWYRGRLYVATADYTEENGGYLKRRGFHWYAFDPAANRFSDRSAAEPGGVGGEHASIVATTIDESRGLIYALSTPTGDLYAYDISAGRTTKLGRPPTIPDGFHMPGRYIWMGREGRVYFTISARSHVLYYDPKSGFGERDDWPIAIGSRGAMVFRTGASAREGERVYLADAGGRIYRYDRPSDGFELLGRAVSESADYNCGGSLKMRAFNVTPDERTIYFINDDAKVSAFWEWDVASRTTKRICDLSALDDRIGDGRFSIHGGNDSWDAAGRLCFCSFGRDPANPTELILTRVDPVALKAHLARSAGEPPPHP